MSPRRPAPLLIALFLGLVLPRLGAEIDFWIPVDAHAGEQRRDLQSLVHRELVRQAVVLAALHHARLLPGDAAVDSPDPARIASLPAVRVEPLFLDETFSYRVLLPGAKPLARQLRIGGPAAERAPRIARALAPLVASELAPALRAAFPAGGRTLPAAPALAPERLGALDREVGAIARFEALRHWHGEAVRNGLSPATLAGLAREYIRLSESSRHHWSAFANACAARAMLYAELLAHAHPDDPATVETAAFVYGVGGYHSTALPLLDALTGREARPDWLPLVNASVRYRHEVLFEAARQGSAFAAQLGLMSLEHLDVPNLYGLRQHEFEELLSGELRPAYASNRLHGVSGRHHTTVAAPLDWWRTFTTRVPQVAGLPAGLAAFCRPAPRAPSIPLLLRLLVEAPDEAPATRPTDYRRFALAARAAPEDGYPGWTVLGRIVWDSHFALTVARLHFMAGAWGVSTEEEVAEALPGLDGHPLQPVLLTLKRGDVKKADPASFARVHLEEVTEVMRDYLRHADGLADRFANKTIDYANKEIWWWAANDIHSTGLLYLSMVEREKGRRSPAVLEISPYNPRFLAHAIAYRADWETYREHAAKRQPAHPLIDGALGQRLVRENRHAEALAPLRNAIDQLGEATPYNALAEAHLALGDEASWLEVRMAFDNLPDTGLSRARNRETIALHYLRTRRPALAVPHAEAAAQSWAHWAMQTAVFTYAIAGDKPAAERWSSRLIERYGHELTDGVVALFTLGVGDPEALRAALHTEPEGRVERARDLALFGLHAEAAAAAEATYRARADNYYLLIGALSRLELGDREGARREFARATPELEFNKDRSTSRLANRDLAELFARALAGSVPTPDFISEIEAIRQKHGVPSLGIYDVDYLYFASRFLRLTGEPDHARRFALLAAENPRGPGTNRYVTPMLAHEMRLHGLDLLDRYRPSVE